jgi:DnaJ-class molecular chaperone
MKKIIVIVVLLIGALIFIFAAEVIDSHKYVTCYSCDGSGKKEVKKTCTSCKGRGQVFCTNTYTFNYTWFGGGGSETVRCDGGTWYDPRLGSSKTCYYCNGSSYHDCNTCSGYGEIKTTKDCTRCGGDGEERKNIKITLAEEWDWD